MGVILALIVALVVYVSTFSSDFNKDTLNQVYLFLVVLAVIEVLWFALKVAL